MKTQKSAEKPKQNKDNKGFIPQQNPNKHFVPKGNVMASRMNKFAVKRGNR